MDLSYYPSLSTTFPSFLSPKPLIILCPDQDFLDGKWKLKFNDAAQIYADALRKEGAEVLVLKGYNQSHEQLFALMDGWLIPGGLDIDPKKYNAAKHPKTVSLESHEQRYNFEVEMYRKMPKILPILGICYGSQLLNVLNGGSLVQHISNYEEHCEGKVRTVNISKNSKLAFSVKNQDSVIKVKCYHHQVIEKKGVNIEPIVYDSDGSIHGIQLNEPERWVVGVQWHPERSQDDKNREIIREFVRQADAFRVKKTAVWLILTILCGQLGLKKKVKKAQ